MAMKKIMRPKKPKNELNPKKQKISVRTKAPSRGRISLGEKAVEVALGAVDRPWGEVGTGVDLRDELDGIEVGLDEVGLETGLDVEVRDGPVRGRIDRKGLFWGRRRFRGFAWMIWIGGGSIFLG